MIHLHARTVGEIKEIPRSSGFGACRGVLLVGVGVYVLVVVVVVVVMMVRREMC